MKRSGTRILVSIVALGALVPAQDDPAPDPADLARRLRSGSLSGEARAEIVDALIACGEEGARRLFHVVRPDLERGEKDVHKKLARHAHDVERSAKILLRELGRGRAAKRIETLRDEILAFSRGGELTKAVIHDEIDPRYAELQKLLVVDVADVFAADEDLAEEAVELDATAAELVTLFLDQERAEEVLLRSDEGTRLLDRYPLAPDPRGLAREIAAARRDAVTLAIAEHLDQRRTLDANRDDLATLDPEEADGIRRLNRIRGVLGLNALRVDLKLCDAGREHSKDMVRLGFFAHTSPVPGKETPGKRAALAGTSGGAENIAAGQPDGAGAIRAWWYSPGHHRNMLGGHGRIGLGRHQQHWTQMFGG